MTVDRQLPIEPTVRIDPRTLVEHIPGVDAICLCYGDDLLRYGLSCAWPFCGWKDHLPDHDNEREAA